MERRMEEAAEEHRFYSIGLKGLSYHMTVMLACL